MNKLNLDELQQNNFIALKGIEYTIPPMSYGMAEKLTKVNSKTQLDVLVDVLLEYINSNLEGKKFDKEEFKNLLSMKQMVALLQFLTEQLTKIEKN